MEDICIIFGKAEKDDILPFFSNYRFSHQSEGDFLDNPSLFGVSFVGDACCLTDGEELFKISNEICKSISKNEERAISVHCSVKTGYCEFQEFNGGEKKRVFSHYCDSSTYIDFVLFIIKNEGFNVSEFEQQTVDWYK